jgi:hypothetical protein
LAAYARTGTAGENAVPVEKDFLFFAQIDEMPEQGEHVGKGFTFFTDHPFRVPLDTENGTGGVLDGFNDTVSAEGGNTHIPARIFYRLVVEGIGGNSLTE